MDELLLEQIPLGPQLTLELYDCSRLLAGDRWKVILEARLEVALHPALWEGSHPPEPTRGAMTDILGETQRFVQRRERIFVSAQEREALMKGFVAGIKNDLVPYLKHPAFVKRFLEKQYRKAKERRQWTPSTP
ncbi:MAG: hypothetical protein WBG37_05120 [Desulfobacterales bacterium]